MAVALLEAHPSSSSVDPIKHEKSTIVAPENNLEEISDNKLQETEDETEMLMSDPLQRRFEEIIAKSLEQILGKTDIEGDRIVDTPCSNHNVEIIHPKIEETVVLEDKDVEKEIKNSVEDKEETGNSKKDVLQKREVSEVDKSEGVAGPKKDILQEIPDNFLEEPEQKQANDKMTPEQIDMIETEPLQKKVEKMIEKSFEQILGKDDIKEVPFVDTPCSNHNVEIIQPKIEETVVLEDKDVATVGDEEIESGAGKDIPMNHALQKKDVTAVDKSQPVVGSTDGLKDEKEKIGDGSLVTENNGVEDNIKENEGNNQNLENDEPLTTGGPSTAKPDPIVELMNRLKEQMEKASMKDLSPMLETINNMTLMGRMDALATTTTTTELPEDMEEPEVPRGPIPCTCGVFLSGQFKKGSKDQPKGVPVLTQEMDMPFLNNVVGNRQCTNKCLELIIKHLPKSSEIICATTERDRVYKEKAYLFIKNWSDKWMATNLSAGREFCCKENLPYKCPKS